MGHRRAEGEKGRVWEEGGAYGTNEGVEAGIGVLPSFSHFLFIVLLLFLSCFQGRGWEDHI